MFPMLHRTSTLTNFTECRLQRKYLKTAITSHVRTVVWTIAAKPWPRKRYHTPPGAARFHTTDIACASSLREPQNSNSVIVPFSLICSVTLCAYFRWGQLEFCVCLLAVFAPVFANCLTGIWLLRRSKRRPVFLFFRRQKEPLVGLQFKFKPLGYQVVSAK